VIDPPNDNSTTIDMPSKTANGNTGGGQVSHRLRSFFRINSSASSVHGGADKEREKEKDSSKEGKPGSLNDDGSAPTRPFRGRFFSSTVGRFRSQTVASEGNQLEEALSPTAHANPYFAHQGLPGLRHHNEGSVPPSPPDTPTFKVSGPDGDGSSQNATTSTKEELARRLRRVASAPNTQGLFAKDADKAAGNASDGDRPATANLSKDPLLEDPSNPGSLSLVDSKLQAATQQSLSPPSDDNLLSPLQGPNSLAFRRTYSSNSIKVRSVEVSPASFDKVKLIGKGDVGKVYLVREKKSNRLYAMKGKRHPSPPGEPACRVTFRVHAILDNN
jgi:protein-serine/threonine kinase